MTLSIVNPRLIALFLGLFCYAANAGPISSVWWVEYGHGFNSRVQDSAYLGTKVYSLNWVDSISSAHSTQVLLTRIDQQGNEEIRLAYSISGVESIVPGALVTLANGNLAWSARYSLEAGPSLFSTHFPFLLVVEMTPDFEIVRSRRMVTSESATTAPLLLPLSSGLAFAYNTDESGAILIVFDYIWRVTESGNLRNNGINLYLDNDSESMQLHITDLMKTQKGYRAVGVVSDSAHGWGLGVWTADLKKTLAVWNLDTYTFFLPSEDAPAWIGNPMLDRLDNGGRVLAFSVQDVDHTIGGYTTNSIGVVRMDPDGSFTQWPQGTSNWSRMFRRFRDSFVGFHEYLSDFLVDSEGQIVLTGNGAELFDYGVSPTAADGLVFSLNPDDGSVAYGTSIGHNESDRVNSIVDTPSRWILAGDMDNSILSATPSNVTNPMVFKIAKNDAQLPVDPTFFTDSYNTVMAELAINVVQSNHDPLELEVVAYPVHSGKVSLLPLLATGTTVEVVHFHENLVLGTGE